MNHPRGIQCNAIQQKMLIYVYFPLRVCWVVVVFRLASGTTARRRGTSCKTWSRTGPSRLCPTTSSCCTSNSRSPSNRLSPEPQEDTEAVCVCLRMCGVSVMRVCVVCVCVCVGRARAALVSRASSCATSSCSLSHLSFPPIHENAQQPQRQPFRRDSTTWSNASIHSKKPNNV